MWPDGRYALRSIAKKPLFYSVVVILTLALGIGANAAIFTVVNGVLLQPLPYPHSDRLMMVWTHNPRQGLHKDVGNFAAAGLAIGICGALALTHVLAGLLFGVGARDPLTFVVVPGALLVAALAACLIPARRAMHVQPAIALRGDS